jgi:hypothetical protein
MNRFPSAYRSDSSEDKVGQFFPILRVGLRGLQGWKPLGPHFHHPFGTAVHVLLRPRQAIAFMQHLRHEMPHPKFRFVESARRQHRIGISGRLQVSRLGSQRQDLELPSCDGDDVTRRENILNPPCRQSRSRRFSKRQTPFITRAIHVSVCIQGSVLPETSMNILYIFECFWVTAEIIQVIDLEVSVMSDFNSLRETGVMLSISASLRRYRTKGQSRERPTKHNEVTRTHSISKKIRASAGEPSSVIRMDDPL